jgi:hypothetical protein
MSMTSILANALIVYTEIYQVKCVDPEQTEQMCRLIWVYTGHNVTNAVLSN